MKENYCDSKVGLVGYLLYGINPEIIITSRIACAPHGSAYGDDIILVEYYYWDTRDCWYRFSND